MSVVSCVRHYQKSIEKCPGDKERVLHCINRLYTLPVTVQHLQDTGVGKTINSLRKSEGSIGDAARALVAKWKQMVEEESDNETEAHQSEEDPHKKNSQDSHEAKWPKDTHNKKDKHKSESKAGSSHDKDQLTDNYKENRKRKKESDYKHSREKRRNVESEDEGIDEDGEYYDTVADSDSENLRIEESEEVPEEPVEEYVPEGLSNSHSSEIAYKSEISGKIKSEKVSSDEEYRSHSSQKDLKRPAKESHHHRSHEKSSKKDRHSSDPKHSKRSSSQSVSAKTESRSDYSSSHEADKIKDSSSKSSSSKSREKSSSSSSSRSFKSKEKLKEDDRFESKRVKLEVSSDVLELKKVKTESVHDSYDSKKVKIEDQKKESKSSNSSNHKEQKSSSSSSMKKGSDDSSSSSVDKSKHKDKEKKDKLKEKHHSKDDRKSKEKRKEKDRNKSPDGEEDGVDSFSGTSFAEALGMCIPEKPRKKQPQGTSSPSTSKVQKPQGNSSDKTTPLKDFINSPRELDKQCASLPLEPLDVDEDFGLPTLNPNYKPLPQPTSFFDSPPKKLASEDEALTNIMYSKVQRTKVFSGNKTGYTSVPSLFDLCTRVLQENIDALEFTGGVPFDLLKPVLERATPDQLFTLEHFNAYLIEDTDVFWEFHCKKDFRNKKREEMETWREMYLRCREEREKKLKALTVNIAAANKAKALPVRKTQLAYVEGTVKPPRNIARKQAKFGTAHSSSNHTSSKHSPSSSGSPNQGLSSSFTGRPAAQAHQGPVVAVPTPRGSAGSGQSNSCKPKPKAPLMQKALQLIKYNRFKR